MTTPRIALGRGARWGAGQRVRQALILAVAFVVAFAVGWYVTEVALPRTAATTAQPAAGNRAAAAASVVQVQPARTGSMAAVLTYASTVQATQQVGIAPRAVGIVQEISVDVGSS